MGAAWIKRRAGRDEDGSIIVEFGLLFVPLLAVIFSIMEVALVLLSEQVLQTNTASAARLIERGSALGLSAPDTESALRSAICAGSLVLVGKAACEASVKVDLRVIDGSPVPGMFTSDGAVNGAAFGVVNGVAGNGMLVRVALQLPSLTGLPALFAFNGGPRIVTAGAVIRIDPFAQYNNTGSSPAPVL